MRGILAALSADPQNSMGTDVSFNLLALALVDCLALIGGLYALWRSAKRARRFVALALRSSLAAAVRRSQFTSRRQAMKCALDIHYYVSRLAILFSVNLLSLSGVTFAALVSIQAGATASRTYSVSSSSIASGSMIIFAALALKTFVRTLRLARKVMRIRMKRRSAAARNYRFSSAESRSLR